MCVFCTQTSETFNESLRGPDTRPSKFLEPLILEKYFYNAFSIIESTNQKFNQVTITLSGKNILKTIEHKLILC